LRWLPALFAVLLVARPVRADVIEAPVGGRPIALVGRVACTTGAGGFTVEAGGRMLRPPTDPNTIGQEAELRMAATPAECNDNATVVTLIATDRWPTVEPSSVVFSPDDGRLDLRGRGLNGVTVAWTSRGHQGTDTCHDPKPDGDLEHCAWGVGAGAAVGADADLSWLPNGARAAPDASFYDAMGRPVPADAFSLSPVRIVLRRLVPSDAAVDLSTGRGEVPLVHPEAVASAECKAVQCEMANGTLEVRGASSLVNQVEVKMRLLPHMTLAVKDGFDAQPVAKLPVLHCPMSIVSGAPVRNDEAKVVVKLQGGCSRDLSSVRFATDRGPVPVLQTVNLQDASFVLLGLGNITEDAVTLSALRDPDGIALAVAHTPTRAAPRVRASIEIPPFPNLDFIPNNRDAIVHIPAVSDHEYYALLPIEGVYAAGSHDGVATIRGDANAAGLTELRFGLRNRTLPPPLDKANLSETEDPLQRSIHEANIPAPIGLDVTPNPLVEMMCGSGKDSRRITLGVTDHLSYDLRDTCRVIFHRERLSSEYGTQKLNFEVEVIKTDGTTRGDAHVSEVVTLRSGSEPRYAWIRGVVDPFDRVVVRISHQADETHYMGASEIKTGAPAVQWSVVLGTGRVRLYGTTAIPTGLYRFSDKGHSGVLTLNFGVISRLTWLDSEGHEGFLGAEGGIMAIGLAGSQSDNGTPLTQVGAVLGLGVSVPVANRGSAAQASINLHAWFEANITRTSSKDPGGRYAFIFGPSITIGNVGVNL
jgi:hypothetical protein